jgi:hypothetical protein
MSILIATPCTPVTAHARVVAATLHAIGIAL